MLCSVLNQTLGVGDGSKEVINQGCLINYLCLCTFMPPEVLNNNIGRKIRNFRKVHI